VSHAESLEVVKEGVAAARAGEKVRARQLFLDAVGLDPDNDSARLWLASVAESPLESLEHLEHVLTLNPQHEKALAAARAARVRAGVAAAKAGDAPLALKLLRKAVEEDPDCEKAWVWLAGVAETPEQAVAALEQALEINPDNELTRTALENYRLQARAAEPVAGHAAVPSVQVETKPQTILVVDDSATVREILMFVLGRHGYAVLTAADAAEAVTSLRQDGIPDAILLDVTLPGQDGFTLCRLLRQQPETAQVPVVMLSEQAGFVNGMRSHMAGADDVCAKTLELDGLLGMLGRLCPSEHHQ
jgi:CheY-like chemotaxis protein